MEKKKVEIEVDCRMCSHNGTCSHVGKVCREFCPMGDSLRDRFFNAFKSSQVTGTWQDAVMWMQENGWGAARQAWKDNAFVFWRKHVTVNVSSDPYMAECLRRSDGMGVHIESHFVRFSAMSSVKGLPMIRDYTPHVEDREAEDWYPIYIGGEKNLDDIPAGLANKLFSPKCSFSFSYRTPADKSPNVPDRGDCKNSLKVEAETKLKDLNCKCSKSIQDKGSLKKTLGNMSRGDDKCEIATILKKLFDGLDETAEIMKSLDDLLK